MREVECQAIHQLQSLLQLRGTYQQLMDSFLLFTEKKATTEDLQRMARYLNEQAELLPSKQCILEHLHVIQGELDTVERQVYVLAQDLRESEEFKSEH